MSVVVRPVSSRRDIKEFIELPFRLHSNSGVWVPPLRLERRLFLMRSQNAFFTHGDAQLFLAERDGRVVGRISAQYDQAFNEFHKNAWGMFGFLEFEDAPDIVAPLLDAARAWLKAHGREYAIGPLDFTMNDEAGVMIEGFEREPMIKQPWHPPYYQARLEEAGLEKAMDLLMYELQISDRSKILPVIFRLAEKVEPRYGIKIRRMTRRGLRKDMDRFAEVYNAAWSDNWGFVPFSKKDLDVYTQEMHLVFDPDWYMVAETADGDTAAVAITVPGHQPGAAQDERAPAAARLVVFPAPPQDHRPRARRLPRRRAGVPAHRRRGQALRRALRHVGTDAGQVGRDGLDPRDQPQHEQGDGGDGRSRRPPLPRLLDDWKLGPPDS